MSDEHYICCECGCDDGKIVKYMIDLEGLSPGEVEIMRIDYGIYVDEPVTMDELNEVNKILELEVSYTEIDICPVCDAEDSFRCVDHWEKEVR